MINYSKGYKIISITTILKILKEFNEKFIPNISLRIDLREYAKKIHENSYMILAIETKAKKIVGFCFFYDNNSVTREAYLTLIAIDDHFQGKGIGAQLMKLMITHTKNQHLKNINLEVNRNNSSAINLYYKFNFKVVKEVDGSLYMKKSLE